jgi:hypothetical protein
MRKPIPRVRKSTLRLGPRMVYGRPEVAVAVICPGGIPVGADAVQKVLAESRVLINESLLRRKIPNPPRGWRLIMIHPDEQWRDYLSPGVVAQAEAELADAPASAAVVVVLAMTRGERR